MRTKPTFLALLCLGTLLTAAPFQAPQSDGYITDPTRILSPRIHQALEQQSKQLEQASGAQVITAIIPELGEDWTIESYAVQLFKAWGIGQKKSDNGVLLLVALKEKKVRIEVGYGLEGAIPDGLAGQIIDELIVPNFKQGQFEEGITKGHSYLLSRVAKEYNVTLSNQDQPRQRHSNQGQPQRPLTPAEKAIAGLILAAIIIGMIVSPTFRSIMFWVIISTMFRSGGNRSGSGHFGGGGFGGFGGGMSGGGGASRGW